MGQIIDPAATTGCGRVARSQTGCIDKTGGRVLAFHDTRAGRLVPCGPEAASLPIEVNWIDAFLPDQAEVAFLRRTLNIEVPTLEKMSEIESSSRLYHEGDNLFLTITIAILQEDGACHSTPLGFVVTAKVLLTVRFESIKVCEGRQPAAPGGSGPLLGGVGALIVLLEALIDHVADNLENVTANLNQHSQLIFTDQTSAPKPRPKDDDRNLRHVLVRIGQVRAYTSLISETLLEVTRLTRYVVAEASPPLSEEAKARLGRLASDAISLSEHETRLSEKLQFLLDASLGLISVDQNDIFKVLTMVSVIGIPPTLLASMYGMNFKSIPEYDWAWGYEYALFMILMSALIPLLWFKWRRWW